MRVKIMFDVVLCVFLWVFPAGAGILNAQLDSVFNKLDLSFKLALNHNFVHKIPGDSYRARLHRTRRGKGFKIGLLPEYRLNNLKLGLGLSFSRQNYFREQYSSAEQIFNRRDLQRVYDINLSTVEFDLGANYTVLNVLHVYGSINREMLLSGAYRIDLFQFGEFLRVESDDRTFSTDGGRSVWSGQYGIGISPFKIRDRHFEIQIWRKYNLSRKFVGPPLFDNRITQYGVSLKIEVL